MVLMGIYTILPGVTFIEDRNVYDNSGLLYPQGNDGTDPGIFGANFSEAVPGPLPLVGAAAAFGWSRRLRKRVKVAGSES
jgi:hypothetical protein